MGACVVRELDDREDSELLLTPVPIHRETNKLGSPVAFAGGPFRFRVRRSQGNRDLEGEALRSLLDLVCASDSKRKSSSVDVSKTPVSASRCIDNLLSLQAAHRECLLDLVVPVTTVMLHVSDKAIRQELWEFFVSVAVRKDNMLGHLFYWALRSVAKCPQAQPNTKKEASRLLELVGAELKKGQTNGSSGKGVSPLIDLFDQLHDVGDALVNEKEKLARQKLLTSLLEKVNTKLPEATRVPMLMMIPDADRRKPGCLPGSSLLRVPPTEGGVLSSKARAPYHVLVEIETRASSSRAASAKGALGFLCCKRAAPRTNGAPDAKSLVKSKADGGRVRSASSLKREKDKRPKGLFKDETWEEVCARVRASSQYGAHPNWGLVSLIVKASAEDIMQEEMAYRLVKWFQRVFTRNGLRRLWLRPFLILATQHDAGCLEAVTNAISIDALKKHFGTRWTSLKKYFEETFTANGSGEGVSFNQATSNFVDSMAAYSIICYVLSIRDRHNGNIMLDDVGHIIHVDFGFMLCGAPGGRAVRQLGLSEPAHAFKLTAELVEVLESRPDGLKAFRQLLVSGLMAVRDGAEELLSLLQLSMLGSENSSMACFASDSGYAEAVLEDVCDRLCLPRKGSDPANVRTDAEFKEFVDRLVDDSVDHWRSRLYDQVQYMQNGIL